MKVSINKYSIAGILLLLATMLWLPREGKAQQKALTKRGYPRQSHQRDHTLCDHSHYPSQRNGRIGNAQAGNR
ncbi:hypothetical protein [Porphyromonas gingivicanis]|uniref:hypothetical protein n=1 Tax=Porphyromonas gingivicanis TaxID=266762 RepID=UPI00046F2F4E|nr:hypothetical protein [Porphyromonas gingivicanis]